MLRCSTSCASRAWQQAYQREGRDQTGGLLARLAEAFHVILAQPAQPYAHTPTPVFPSYVQVSSHQNLSHGPAVAA